MDRITSDTSVSVIIPCYRQAHFLPVAIESVLSQTWATIELIVVNDGSDDDVEAAIAPYRGRLTYVEQANRGLSGARNSGLAMATGDFSLFLDADDLLAPEAIERLLNAITGEQDVSVMQSIWFTDGTAPEAGRPVAWQMHQPLLASILSGTIAPVHCWLVRRRAALGVGGFDETLTSHEDWDFWIRLAFGGARLQRVDYAGAYYRQAAGSMSQNYPRMSASGCRVSVMSYRRFLVDCSDEQLLASWCKTASYWLYRGLTDCPETEPVRQLELMLREVRDRRPRGFHQVTSTVLERVFGLQRTARSVVSTKRFVKSLLP